MKRNFKVLTTVYNESSRVESNCNAISFFNPPTSTVTFTVDDMPVVPGSYFSTAGLEGEEDKTVYRLAFPNAATGGVCFVQRKIYLP